jgi:PAS domain S-box-containing protein
MSFVSRILRDSVVQPDARARWQRFVVLARSGALIASVVLVIAVTALAGGTWESSTGSAYPVVEIFNARQTPIAIMLCSVGILCTWYGKPSGLAAPAGLPRAVAAGLSLASFLVIMLTEAIGLMFLTVLLAFAIFLQQSRLRTVANWAQVLLTFTYFGALAAWAGFVFSDPGNHAGSHGQTLSVAGAIGIGLLSVSAILVDLPRGPGRFIVYEDPAGIGMRRLVPLAMTLPIVCVLVGLAGIRFGLFNQSGMVLVLTVVPSMTLVTAVWRKSLTIHAAAIMQRRTQARLRRKSVDLRQANHMMRVFDSIESFIGVLKPDGTILQINRAALEVGGLTLDGVIGMNFAGTKWWAGHPQWAREMEEIIKRVANGERIRRELPYATASGAVSTTDFVMAPLFGADGKVEFLIPSGMDITARKDFEDQLVRARVDAEIANRAKSAFLSHMSHELRSPLGIILGFIDLVVEEKDEAEKSRHLETIKRNALQLLALVDEVLDLGKIESGKISIDIEDVRLDKFVAEIATSLEVKAKERGIGLVFEIAPGTPMELRTDPLRLKQILLNVVGNGVKYTEKGSVSCLVRRVIRVSDAQEIIEFSVSDTGSGISGEDVGRLFVPFYRGQQKKYAGTGLGLVLSRRLARLLGGDVILEHSEPGRGSTFVVSIVADRRVDTDLAALSSHVIGMPEGVPPRGKLAGMRILVVDDVADNRLLISRYLESAGAMVATAAGGGEAVAMALQDGFDVVLMDLSMPDMSGQDATAVMRKEGYRIPIVALTAHAMREEKEMALAHGFNEYLTKPVIKEVLIDAMARIHDAVKKSA